MSSVFDSQAFNANLFFPRGDTAPTPGNSDEIQVEVEPKTYVHIRRHPSPEARFSLLFFHGNAGNISFRLNYIKTFYDIGFSLLFFDYPGFGLSEGLPNEENCIETGHLYYSFLINKKKYKHSDIIFYGESIGGSIVTCVANKINAKYLILQSTFTDIKKIIKKLILGNYVNIVIDQIGFETLNYLKKRYKMNLIEKKMKTLIIHSYDDEIIDVSNAKELSSYSDDLIICEGTHSNIKMNNELIFKIIDFIDK